MKERFTNEKLVEKLPTQYYLFMNHLLSLLYETEPDYYYLKQLLESMSECEGVSLNETMEWQRDGFEKQVGQTTRSNRRQQEAAPPPPPPPVEEVRTNPLNQPVELQEVEVPYQCTPSEAEAAEAAVAAGNGYVVGSPPQQGIDAYDDQPKSLPRERGERARDANDNVPAHAYGGEDEGPPAPLSTENEGVPQVVQEKPVQHAKVWLWRILYARRRLPLASREQRFMGFHTHTTSCRWTSRTHMQCPLRHKLSTTVTQALRTVTVKAKLRAPQMKYVYPKNLPQVQQLLNLLYFFSLTNRESLRFIFKLHFSLGTNRWRDSPSGYKPPPFSYGTEQFT